MTRMNIVVGILFTADHYDNVPFIPSLYPGIEMVFYGEQPNDDVLFVEHQRGIFSYRALIDLASRYDRAGYMIAHDDFFLNWKTLSSLDPNRVWHQPYGLATQTDLACWYWWGTPHGAPAYDRVAAALPVFSTLGGICCGYSDLVYVPRRLIAKLTHVLKVTSDAELFVELALPNAIHAFTNPSDRCVLNTIDHCRFQYGTDEWMDLYRPDHHGVHPVKYSDPRNRHLAKLEAQRITRLLTD